MGKCWESFPSQDSASIFSTLKLSDSPLSSLRASTPPTTRSHTFPWTRSGTPKPPHRQDVVLQHGISLAAYTCTDYCIRQVEAYAMPHLPQSSCGSCLAVDGCGWCVASGRCQSLLRKVCFTGACITSGCMPAFSVDREWLLRGLHSLPRLPGMHDTAGLWMELFSRHVSLRYNSSFWSAWLTGAGTRDRGLCLLSGNETAISHDTLTTFCVVPPGGLVGPSVVPNPTVFNS
jgi:hypothetical protein